MNKLEKFFNTLHSSQSKVLKKYTTDELVSQIREYADFTPFICRNVYRMLISQSNEDRVNGAAILKGLMFQFRLVTDFKIEYTKSKDEYLCSTGEEFVAKNISIKEQKRMVKAMANLEHVECSIVNEIDFKADTSFQIKKQKVKDKPIENVMDFFDNLTGNLLNYEWNKRHGAFLAFTSMFSEAWEGETEIKVDSSLFMKIYEILKNDKFNDFVDDKTTAPVRKAAAQLLSCIFPRIPKNTILDELFLFLEDEDWQTQYSGLVALNYLKGFIKKKKELCLLLEKMLGESDEDVKFLSAELLCEFAEFCNLKGVASKCWENIRNEEEIAVSKTSIISLLAKIHAIDNKVVCLEDNIDLLFPCFTSPVFEVRRSVLEMVRAIENESINFLIAETILLDEKEEVRDLAVDILKNKSNLGENFINLFMKILSGCLYEPYSTDDFVSYDELLFTKSGVKLVGEDLILKNRVRLFEAMRKDSPLSFKPSTAIGKVFEEMYNLFRSMKVKEERKEGCMKVKESINDNTTPPSCINTNAPPPEDPPKRQRIEEHESEEALYKKYVDLRLVPLKELKAKVVNPQLTSLHPMGDPLFRDFLRLKAILNFPLLEGEISLFYTVETCGAFLRLLSSLIIRFYEERALDISGFVYGAYKATVEGEEGFLPFFEEFGCGLLTHKVFPLLLEDKDKLAFFSKTISFYTPMFDRLEDLFVESYERKSIPILRGFVKDLKYGEKFVCRILTDFDVSLVGGLIPDLDHSFYPLLVKKLLREMASEEHREESSRAFSFIVPRLSFQMNSSLSPEMVKDICTARESLKALLDIKKIGEYKAKCPTSIVLRNYQVEGVKWIAFLHSFHLNGILADDMGLGKTIQVLYFVCSEIYQTNKQVLILCPSSLTGHWKGEIEKFFPFVSSFVYKKKKRQEGSVAIVSYDMFRNDYLSFVEREWFYVILDEGHILRNSQTLLYSRVCQLKPTNKLVLTGTPVHNSVEDLVSLFNFLMPKYLTSSRDCVLNGKMSDSEVEKVYMRLEELNKKILPFILRRLKMDVLKDLPPKIIRDITVEMGPVQQGVYDTLQEGVTVEGVSYRNAEGLKRTRDLLYASSHTLYFKKEMHKNESMHKNGNKLSESILKESILSETPCKVKALEDIINLCGGEDIRNKILIFFQYKSTIELVLEDIKRKFNLKYLRLDGTVPSSKRSKIAQDFNEGGVPLLFLTTQVGGLGLNLTGADTVVFYEHDWNPFNDLQAMDRAHRIGQKKTVNVFRLITKGTIEERVMDLQSFKLFVASSLVSQQNADIETMDTKDLLERFQ